MGDASRGRCNTVRYTVRGLVEAIKAPRRRALFDLSMRIGDWLAMNGV
jgi:hypothetical protein